jgi:hypothetical protein
MQLNGPQAMATYCVVWGTGSAVPIDCTHEPGDHWADMMRGGPAGKWDENGHRWVRGMM